MIYKRKNYSFKVVHLLGFERSIMSLRFTRVFRFISALWPNKKISEPLNKLVRKWTLKLFCSRKRISRTYVQHNPRSFFRRMASLIQTIWRVQYKLNYSVKLFGWDPKIWSSRIYVTLRRFLNESDWYPVRRYYPRKMCRAKVAKARFWARDVGERRENNTTRIPQLYTYTGWRTSL